MRSNAFLRLKGRGPSVDQNPPATFDNNTYQEPLSNRTRSSFRGHGAVGNLDETQS